MKRSKIKNGSKYIVLSDHHLYVAESLSELEKQSGLQIEESEMKRIDNHYITRLSDVDIDFIMDKKKMSNIPWQNLIKKDKTINYLIYAMLILQVLTFIRG